MFSEGSKEEVGTPVEIKKFQKRISKSLQRKKIMRIPRPTKNNNLTEIQQFIKNFFNYSWSTQSFKSLMSTVCQKMAKLMHKKLPREMSQKVANKISQQKYPKSILKKSKITKGKH